MVAAARNNLEEIVKCHKNLIEDYNVENYVETYDDDEEGERFLELKKKSNFYKWIKNIVKFVDKNHVNHALNESIEETESDRNPYVSKTLIEPLMKFLSNLSLFSNIMTGVFNSDNKKSSSGCTEVTFNHLKSYIFKRKKGNLNSIFYEVKFHLKYVVVV